MQCFMSFPSLIDAREVVSIIRLVGLFVRAASEQSEICRTTSTHGINPSMWGDQTEKELAAE